MEARFAVGGARGAAIGNETKRNKTLLRGAVSGIDGNADWIDATILGLSDCQNCTVDFSTPITSDSSAAPEPGTLGLLGGALTGFLTLVRRRVMR